MAGATKSQRKRGRKTTIARRRAVNAGNARRREQAKRKEPANTIQQGNRANARQNTTAQGHGRPK